MALNTSVGIQTWELITCLGAVNQLELNIFLPCTHNDDVEALSSHVRDRFRLDEHQVTFIPVFPTDESREFNRDREVVTRAHSILPVSIRPGGYMEGLIEQAKRQGKPVDRRFEVKYQPRRQPLGYRIDSEHVNPEVEKLNDSYLIHWTRSSNGPWPTESLFDYYGAIIDSEDYPRSAFHTLSNILDTRIIKGSPKNIPGKVAAVSFSNRPPAKMAELMSWRSRYRVMSFEPYGIGIEKRTALEKGVLPVIYYDRSSGDSAKCVNGSDRWRTQSRGVKSDWSVEDEYRLAGDLAFSDIPRNSLIAICHTEDEAEQITAKTGIRTVPFVVKGD
ncbi:MAG: hypothetical protein JSV52_06695 [Candidatus Zixiibacteriota bacterium]|nr:MAG: hypothetical protein JSV52_06695 [candidate division Zixibacteria bacterium]